MRTGSKASPGQKCWLYPLFLCRALFPRSVPTQCRHGGDIIKLDKRGHSFQKLPETPPPTTHDTFRFPRHRVLGAGMWGLAGWLCRKALISWRRLGIPAIAAGWVRAQCITLAYVSAVSCKGQFNCAFHSSGVPGKAPVQSIHPGPGHTHCPPDAQ